MSTVTLVSHLQQGNGGSVLVLRMTCNTVIVHVERRELGTVHGCYEGGREIETLSGSREDAGVISGCFLVISLSSICIYILSICH
jgi:hypothetical protein